MFSKLSKKFLPNLYNTFKPLSFTPIYTFSSYRPKSNVVSSLSDFVTPKQDPQEEQESNEVEIIDNYEEQQEL